MASTGCSCPSLGVLGFYRLFNRGFIALLASCSRTATECHRVARSSHFKLSLVLWSIEIVNASDISTPIITPPPYRFYLLHLVLLIDAIEKNSIEHTHTQKRTKNSSTIPFPYCFSFETAKSIQWSCEGNPRKIKTNPITIQ